MMAVRIRSQKSCVLMPSRNVAAEAEAALKAVGVPVETLTCPGIGHSIDGDGLQRGGQLLQRVLS